MVTCDSRRPGVRRDAPVEVRIRDDERAAFERLGLALIFRGEVRGFARGIDAEDLFQQEQRADDADDCRGIRDGIGQRRQREPIRRDARAPC
jgi:hypothetical protein